MSYAGADADVAILMAEARRPSLVPTGDEKVPVAGEKQPVDEKLTALSETSSDRLGSPAQGRGQTKWFGMFKKTEHVNIDDAPEPTGEELETLRRVTGKIPWLAYTVAFVELCERFSYYGTTAVCKLIICAQPY